ncbi:MAG: HD domain-containing protein [Bacillales bacterium]|nr:HD domain-containing protein [Bacillales bacterium]
MEKLVKEFKEGDRIETTLLITNVSKGVSNAGIPYLSISFQDNSGTIEGKKWDANELDIAICEVGKIVDVSFDVIDYRNALQLKVISVKEIDQSKVDVNRFALPCPVKQEELVKKLNGYISSLKNEDCKKIVNLIINKYYSKFITYPAATKNHHEFASGLLYHTLSMADISMLIASYYDNIDTDILLSGCLLHDVGKVIELSGPIATKYTLEGKLLGHISIMVSEIRKTCEELNITSEVGLLLEHMVLSHHGEKEFGSPVPPLTKEAVILHFVDDLDSKMNILSKALELTNEGEFTQRLIAMDGRAFYKPKKSKSK